MTEDEEEIKAGEDKEAQEFWKMKKDIKYAINKNNPLPTGLHFYKIGRVLGKGAFGKVNIAMQKLTKKICAVKSISLKKIMNAHTIKKIATEKKILECLRHPNIVKHYETI